MQFVYQFNALRWSCEQRPTTEHQDPSQRFSDKIMLHSCQEIVSSVDTSIQVEVILIVGLLSAVLIVVSAVA